jgi:hypothetical protein
MIETFDAQSASCAECPAEMIMRGCNFSLM